MKDLLSLFTTCGLGPTTESGVYGVFLYTPYREIKKEKLLYIGSSKNISNRVLNPRHPYRLLFDRFHGTDVIVYVKYFITKNYTELEIECIRKLRPFLNKKHKFY